MINEVKEAEEYLKGNNIQKNDCTYRMIDVLARYFHSQGLAPIDIRKKIFSWAYENSIYIKHNVNDIIKIAINENKPLCNKDVCVTEEEINAIFERFDSKPARICALGMLLFAKAHADEEGIFTFNQIDFAKWVGTQQSHISEIFEELELFDYIERIYSRGEQTFAWNGRIVGKRIKYKMKVKISDSQDGIKLVNNDIKALYASIENIYDEK